MAHYFASYMLEWSGDPDTNHAYLPTINCVKIFVTAVIKARRYFEIRRVFLGGGCTSERALNPATWDAFKLFDNKLSDQYDLIANLALYGGQKSLREVLALNGSIITQYARLVMSKETDLRQASLAMRECHKLILRCKAIQQDLSNQMWELKRGEEELRDFEDLAVTLCLSGQPRAASQLTDHIMEVCLSGFPATVDSNISEILELEETLDDECQRKLWLCQTWSCKGPSWTYGADEIWSSRKTPTRKRPINRVSHVPQ
jgi:hypothetical protein